MPDHVSRWLYTALSGVVASVTLGSAAPRAVDAQQAPRPAATAVEAATSPTIDGRLSDPAWLSAPALAGLVQREPIEGTPVSERTEVRILYDDDAIYVGVWLYDRRPSALVFGQTL